MARLQIFLLVVILATLSVREARVMHGDAKTCYKKSTSFQGKCTDKKACQIACDYEFYQDGYCQDVNTCICSVPCLAITEDKTSATTNVNVFHDVPKHG